MKKNNYCFDPSTPLIYKDTQNGQIKMKGIGEVYKTLGNDAIIYICAMTFNETEHKAELNWKPAKICNTKSSQVVTIYLKPENSISDSILESENIIRVTPNHQFPTLSKTGYKDVEAYLLQTGDKLIFERDRNYREHEKPLFLEDGEIAIEDILLDGSEHFVDYRHIVKVFQENIEESDFYGILLQDDSDKYFMLCNSAISCVSDLQ